MFERKEKRGKKNVRRRWPCWGIALGVVLAAVVAVVAGLCVFAYNDWGLRGVVFSEETGFYEDSIGVELRPEGFLVTGAWIEYNMNGDDLDSTSQEYVDAVRLEVPEEGYQLYTITARACSEHGGCTEPQVATYVLGRNLDEDVTVDIININSSQYNLYDYDVGIMVKGRTYDENKATNSDGWIGGNYNNRGKEWMREAFVTRFDASGQVMWDQVAMMGVSGGSSSAFDVKSFKVELLPIDGSDVGDGAFRLRSGSQDQFSGNIRSSVASRLSKESHLDGGTDTRRLVVFLNGEYYGIFDMQVTFSEKNLAQKFGLGKEKYIEKRRGSERGAFSGFGLDDAIWEELDLAVNCEKLESMIDMDDYLRYYAFFIMVNNTDWPINNFEAWRYGGGAESMNKYEDGRIRFLIRDTDLIYYTEGNGKITDGTIGDIFEFLMENKYAGSDSSFSKVMESEYYREKFIDVLREYLEGPFATENVLKIIDEEAAKIEHQVKLFSTEEEYEEWQGWIELMKKAASEREGVVRQDVEKYFGVEL